MFKSDMNIDDYLNFYTTTTNGAEWREYRGNSAAETNIDYQDWYNRCRDFDLKWKQAINLSPKEGIEMKNLYEVIGVYGEDRKSPVVFRELAIIASDDEDAKVKCGIYKWIKEEWDADYLTIIVRNLGSVKIKEKAKEVKNV
jgi:hypothetical protein